MPALTITKRRHDGTPAWSYTGELVERGPTHLVLRAIFDVPDRDAGFFVWQQGDTFIEWYFTGRWYNVFAVFDRHTAVLRGWYCNITRPARLTDSTVEWEDLELDVMIYPDGRLLLVDEADYAALALTPEERAQADAAVEDIRRRVAGHEAPFNNRSYEVRVTS